MTTVYNTLTYNITRRARASPRCSICAAPRLDTPAFEPYSNSFFVTLFRDGIRAFHYTIVRKIRYVWAWLETLEFLHQNISKAGNRKLPGSEQKGSTIAMLQPRKLVRCKRLQEHLDDNPASQMTSKSIPDMVTH